MRDVRYDVSVTVMAADQGGSLCSIGAAIGRLGIRLYGPCDRSHIEVAVCVKCGS